MKGEYWVTSPYCYCHGAALFAVNGIRHVPAAASGLGLAPLGGLSREETAILAATLLALAFFLFLLFFLCCCCCPGLCWRLCCGCCGSKHGAAGWRKANRLQAADYKIPRAWLENFRGVPEDELDAKIREVEGSKGYGLGHWQTAGAGAGAGLAAGALAGSAGGALAGSAGGAEHRKTSSGGRFRGGVGGSSGVEDATGDFFFGGGSLSRYDRGDIGSDSGFGTGGSGVKTMVVQSSSSRDQSSSKGHGGDVSGSALVIRGQNESSTIDAGTLHKLTEESGHIGGLKKIQLVKETNQRTTTKFDKSGNKETTRTTTTTYNNAGGLGARLMDMLHGITGFGATSGVKRLSIKGRQSSSGGTNVRQSSGGTYGRQTISGRTDTFMSNLAEEGQISSSTMQGRQLSIRGTKGRKSMATGGQRVSSSGSAQYMTVHSSSGGFGGGTGMNEMSVMSSSGGSGGGVATISSGKLGGGMSGGSGDYMYQREIQREFNIHNPENFMKLYNAYRRYLEESSFTRLK